MNQKIQRVVTAVVLVPLAIGLTYLSGWFFLCAVILLSSMAIIEMSKMARKTAKSPQIVPLLVVNLAIQIMAYSGHGIWFWEQFSCSLFFCILSRFLGAILMVQCPELAAISISLALACSLFSSRLLKPARLIQWEQRPRDGDS